jgi:hypothetical protein
MKRTRNVHYMQRRARNSFLYLHLHALRDIAGKVGGPGKADLWEAGA